MTDTDGLSPDAQSHARYVLRLIRAVLMLAVGAMMHLPSPDGSGILPPAVSPRPFVRVAAQQGDATGTPGVLVAHSIVYATARASDTILQASNSTADATVGTAGVADTSRTLAVGDVESRAESPAINLSDEPSPSRAEPDPSAEPTKRRALEQPLPGVPAAPGNVPAPAPLQALASPAVNVPAPPPSHRLQPIVATTRLLTEEDLVRQLLDEYTGAFERRDVRATKALYPTVDGKALKRAFEQITSQRVTLESCDITLSGSTANARCRGSATYKPRIGTRPVQIASLDWTFDLSKQDTSWRIVNTYVR